MVYSRATTSAMAERVAGFFEVLGFVWGAARGGIVAVEDQQTIMTESEYCGGIPSGS